MRTLKILFLSNPAIYLFSDAIYWINGISIFLINISDSFFKKQIFDNISILICFEYFLGYSWPCLTKTKEDKIVKSDLATYFIKNLSAKDIFVQGVFAKVISTKNTFIEAICVDIELSDKTFDYQ